MVPTGWKTLAGTLMHAINSLTFIFSSLYFWHVSKDWRWLIIYAMCANVVTCVAVLFIPESPLYCHSVRDYEKARDSIQKIASFNRYHGFALHDTLFEEEAEHIKREEKAKAQKRHEHGIDDKILENLNLKTEEMDHGSLSDISKVISSIHLEDKEDKELTGSFKELFLVRRLFINLIFMTCIAVACQFNYYLTTFYVKYLPGNIFVNQMVVAVCEIAFFLISYKLYGRLGLKKSLVMGFTFSIMGSVPLIML